MSTVRVLVCGSRSFDDYPKLYNELFNLEAYKWRTIIHGHAKDTDSLADIFAVAHGYEVERYPADWSKYGKAAGPIRNKQMLDEGKPDLVIAFWDGQSPGTENMIDQATKANVPIKVINI